jgi:hypothetical protein
MTSGATSLSEQMKQQWRNMTGTIAVTKLFCFVVVLMVLGIKFVSMKWKQIVWTKTPEMDTD